MCCKAYMLCAWILGGQMAADNAKLPRHLQGDVLEAFMVFVETLVCVCTCMRSHAKPRHATPRFHACTHATTHGRMHARTLAISCTCSHMHTNGRIQAIRHL